MATKELLFPDQAQGAAAFRLTLHNPSLYARARTGALFRGIAREDFVLANRDAVSSAEETRQGFTKVD
jgi:hypothetical protein